MAERGQMAGAHLKAAGGIALVSLGASTEAFAIDLPWKDAVRVASGIISLNAQNFINNSVGMFFDNVHTIVQSPSVVAAAAILTIGGFWLFGRGRREAVVAKGGL